MGTVRLSIVMAVAALTPAVASAADWSTPPPAAPDWIVTVGVEGQTGPAWPGASPGDMSAFGFPLVGIRPAGTPPEFFAPRDSFGFSIIDLGNLKIGPAVQIVRARYASDYAALRGLGDVGYVVQAGGFAEYWPVPWLRLRGEVRQGFGGETGVTGDAFVDAVERIGGLTLSGGPRVTLQSAAAISPYFSVTPAQSAASGMFGLPALPAYQAGGGLYSYGGGAQARYFFTPQWSALAFLEYQRLAGDAAASPLVTERGSPDQLTVGGGITYSFTMHPLW
jgi:MipA family protein